MKKGLPIVTGKPFDYWTLNCSTVSRTPLTEISTRYVPADQGLLGMR